MDDFVLFAFLLFTANKSNSSVRFLGESTARQSAFRFYLTFRLEKQNHPLKILITIQGSTASKEVSNIQARHLEEE